MLNLKVLSPEKIVLELMCNSVTLPSSEGQITVHPQHAQIYTLITHGELVAHADKGDTEIAIGPGFAEINAREVVVLTNYGVLGHEIDLARAQEARERAEDILRTRERQSDLDFALAQADLARSLVELKIATRRRST
jgi:F-type H+-transporting ATPase subunit epsilon